ncbi:sensor domain-containing phosphodiesterase [Luteibacter sp. PPL201]|uniref:Sensor domain-containing phosphodiesterase n=1 Tax=Luteibacter sahnii TaxID=3021977 RepID=A0ABT6BDY8_9GAMM
MHVFGPTCDALISTVPSPDTLSQANRLVEALVSDQWDACAIQSDVALASVTSERDRLAMLRSLQLWEAIDPPELDRITRLVAQVFDVPTVLVSLVGQDEQRFISKTGFEARGTEREVSICSYAIQQTDVFEVQELREDDRFAQNRLVTGGPLLRFYAGAPLITASGHAIGTLCLIDYVPRCLSEEQRQQLQTFARLVMDQIALRQRVGRRDPVTGLFNRQQFNADLAVLAETKFTDTRNLVLIDAMDLPMAYRLAQALGMGPVEAVIRTVAQRLEDIVAPHAQLYHVAVSRFAFMLPALEPADMMSLLASVEEAVATLVEAQGIPLQPVSYGGIVPFRADDTDDALRKAMSAVQQATLYRKPWQWYDKAYDVACRRQYRLATDVAAGIDKRQFRVVYQPKVRLGDGRIMGAEALLRWTHPELGEVSPAEFIPPVARTPVMQALTDWVIDEVCRQQAEWVAAGFGMPVSINVEASDFADGRLLDRILEPCVRHAVEPGFMELEITEGEWLAGADEVLHQLAKLRQAGIKIAIDDFGTGYSNFSYLYDIPIDTLKLDQRLTRGFMRNERQMAVLHGVIRLCGRIGLSVVAEGIERVEEHASLLRFDCEFGQGFLYSAPVVPEQFVQWMHQGGCVPVTPSRAVAR